MSAAQLIALLALSIFTIANIILYFGADQRTLGKACTVIFNLIFGYGLIMTPTISAGTPEDFYPSEFPAILVLLFAVFYFIYSFFCIWLKRKRNPINFSNLSDKD